MVIKAKYDDMKGYRGETGINLILPDRLQSCLLLVKLLVYPEGEMFKGNSENGKLIYHINDIGIDGMFNDDNDVLSGVSRALCLDQVGQNDGKADTNIEVVLHHKVFLAKKCTCVQMAKILKTMLTIRPWMQGRWRHQRVPCRVRSHRSEMK